MIFNCITTNKDFNGAMLGSRKQKSIKILNGVGAHISFLRDSGKSPT